MYPGFFAIGVWAVIWMASSAGFLTLNYGNSDVVTDSFEKYSIALISGLFAFGFALNRWAKEA